MCEELAQLNRIQGFDLDIVDVDSDPALETKYGEDVPVLLGGAGELCRHRLDTGRVAAYLARCDERQAQAGEIG
jgi:hypothetical protein